ncbi:MAG: glycosyltransferase family 9 protein [Candidatus Omnitrophota bacterium]
MQIDREAVKTILVLRNDRFGEFLLNIPALRALKETFTNASLVAVVNSSVKELAGKITFIDEVMEWNRGRHALSENIRLTRLLKKKRIDIAVMLNPDKDFNIFTYLAGIPVRAGYDRKWGFLLTHKTKDKKYLGERHEVEYNLELVSLIGAATQDKTLSLSIGEGGADDLLNDFNIKGRKNLIALHPWTSDPIKQWPVRNFRELADRLSEMQDTAVAIIGGKEESGKSAELFSNIYNNIINLTGKTTLIQLAALLKKCKLLISGDSGPVHLACAVGTKALVVFRNDIPGKAPQRWGPWGGGNIAIEKNNLSDISVAEVLETAKEALNN